MITQLFHMTAEACCSNSEVMLNDYPIISLYTYVTTHLVKNHVGGYTGENPLDHQFTKNFYIVDSLTSAIR